MTLRGILQVGAVLGTLVSLWWLVDLIGDRREAKVHARYVAAAKATNLDLKAFNTEDERVAAVSEEIRRKAVAAATLVPSANGCTATAEQATALMRISTP